MDLRIYITNLEETSQLYYVGQESIEAQSKEIGNLRIQVKNRDESVKIAEDAVTFQKSELKKADARIEKETNLKIKYKKRASLWPAWLGGGTVVGFVGACLLLLK
jgi:hypothetical protein